MPRDETMRPESGGRVTGGGEPTYKAGEAIGEARPATRELVDRVTEATWSEALSRLGRTPSNPLPLWAMLAGHILRAVANGERDPERIKRLALDGLNGHDWFA
jgi:hypothetical protein